MLKPIADGLKFPLQGKQVFPPPSPFPFFLLPPLSSYWLEQAPGQADSRTNGWATGTVRRPGGRYLRSAGSGSPFLSPSLSLLYGSKGEIHRYWQVVSDVRQSVWAERISSSSSPFLFPPFSHLGGQLLAQAGGVERRAAPSGPGTPARRFALFLLFFPLPPPPFSSFKAPPGRPKDRNTRMEGDGSRSWQTRTATCPSLFPFFFSLPSLFFSRPGADNRGTGGPNVPKQRRAFSFPSFPSPAGSADRGGTG